MCSIGTFTSCTDIFLLWLILQPYGLFSSTLGINSKFKSGNPGLRVIVPFIFIKKKYTKLSSHIAKKVERKSLTHFNIFHLFPLSYYSEGTRVMFIHWNEGLKKFCFEMFKTVQVVNLKIVTDPMRLI